MCVYAKYRLSDIAQRNDQEDGGVKKNKTGRIRSKERRNLKNKDYTEKECPLREE